MVTLDIYIYIYIYKCTRVWQSSTDNVVNKCDNATYNINSFWNCGLDFHCVFDTLFGLAYRWLLGDCSFLLANTSTNGEQVCV